MITKIPFVLPINEKIKSFVTDGRNFYFAFKQKGIRKYSLGMHGKGPLREITSFIKNSIGVFNKDIYSLIIGRSVRTTALYFTTSEDTIYRLSEDGIPDYCFKIQ